MNGILQGKAISFEFVTHFIIPTQGFKVSISIVEHLKLLVLTLAHNKPNLQLIFVVL